MAKRAQAEAGETQTNRDLVGLGRQSISNLGRRIRRARREGGLSLKDLPIGSRAVATVAVTVIAVVTGVLAANVLTGWWPAPVVRIPGQLSPTGEIGRASVALFVLPLVAVGAAMSALAGGGASSSGWPRRSGLLGLAGFGLA